MSTKTNKKLKPLARNLRKIGTKGEALLWRDVLKAKQYWPYQFNRQMFLENQGYVVIRFPESLVVYRIDEVITDIDYAIKCLEQKMEDKKLNHT